MALSPSDLNKLSGNEAADLKKLEEKIDDALRAGVGQEYPGRLGGGYIEISLESYVNPRLLVPLRELYLKAGWARVTFDKRTENVGIVDRGESPVITIKLYKNDVNLTS